jgi:hypothetical protein
MDEEASLKYYLINKEQKKSFACFRIDSYHIQHNQDSLR